MEILLSQVEQVPDLLVESRSGLVQGWDVETLQLALDWSHFFQQLSTRLHFQPGLRTAVERRLCRGHRFSLGHMRRCPELLGLALLENRALPSATYQRLLRSLLLPGGQDKNSFVLLARRRAAFQLLGLHLVPPPEACAEHQVPPQLKAQAQLLLSRLQEEEAIGGISFSSALLDQLPQGLMLYRVVAAALLEPPREAETTAPLLHWLLMGDPGSLSAFCRLLPSPWVASLCSRYPELRPHYFNLLASWGNCLNYDWLQGVWKVSDLGEDQVPWQEMRERVFCLLQEPEPLRSAIETKLNQLKAQDGDFEVRGLSVWTDLMVDVKATDSDNKRAV
ncbi:Fanconi anemia group F protein [Sphaerodactylus townsendi]|uniref:Fanconi anemia group F protein n=1 Tax=Sphaerodactylus townsendi TaxID=933632 RepID=UPI0020260491|nr:Fanconi anemia group F protein [Sphaerodactylus townsendi]XP_048367880.1 Fanconi anemia group F protein [Sphaerodactylus townsendi]XP_048367881.1 Fanconi anemia group F protein [Sphaerodactylus townsendi]XP_048367882.1 Fanconi anemia group F protein [Sphaerodactylus townsendi]